MNIFDKKITVTGGKGFLGAHLLSKLSERGYRKVSVADLPEYNLINLADIKKMYDDQKPEIVIHLAARVGGIGFNQESPALVFYENAMMGIQLIHEAYLRGIEKFVALGTICAYPKFTPVPFHEDDLWSGYPEETNASYGLAKKMMLVQSQAYRQQYGFNSIFLLPVNLYGPHDNFSFKFSHVIPALIRKFHLAQLLSRKDFNGIIRDFMFNRETDVDIAGHTVKLTLDSPHKDIRMVLKHFGISASEPNKPKGPEKQASVSELRAAVEVWGTGNATREFFYADDAAEAIVLATERFNSSEPINIGAEFEISIRDLVGLIVRLMDYKGEIAWDTTKPDGQPRRMLDTTKAYEGFGFKARTSFEDGLTKTIEWYRKQI